MKNLLMCPQESVDNIYKTLTSKIVINCTDKDKEYLFKTNKNALDMKLSGYTDIVINKIVFGYGLFTGTAKVNYDSLNSSSTLPIGNYSHYKIPVVNPSHNSVWLFP